MPTLPLRTCHGSKILQFDNGRTFLSKIHISFYCQYAKFSKLLKAQSQFSKKFMDKFCSPFFVLSITSYFNKQVGHTKLQHTTAPGYKCWRKKSFRERRNIFLSDHDPFLYYTTLILIYDVLHAFRLYYIQFKEFKTPN